MNRTLNVGKDIGNDTTIALVDGDEPVIFSSVIGAGHIQEGSMDGALGYAGHAVAIPDVIVNGEGTSYLVGDGVEEHVLNPVRQIDDGRYLNPTGHMLKPLFYNAIARLNPWQRFRDLDVRFVIGVPTALYSGQGDEVKAALSAWLLNEHKFSVNGETYTVNVPEFAILPQPFGTLVHLGLDRGRIVVIDIGYGDVQVFVLNATRRGKEHIEKQRTGSEPIGAHMIVKELRAVTGVNLSDADARALLAGQVDYLPDGRKVGSFAQQAIDNAAPRIIDYARGLVGNVAGQHVGTGGGAALLRFQLTSAFAGIAIPQNPTTANAAGFAKAAALKWG